MEEIRFDDVDAQQKYVSEEFGEFGDAVEVTQEMVNQFADVTGDHQWIHIDVERCKQESPFGGPIVHGFFTLSLMPKLSESTPMLYKTTGVKNAVNYGSDKLRFLSPVPAGSKLHARSRLVSVEAGKKGVRVEREAAIHVVGSDRPAVLYNMITLLQG
jgi:acyl dehydratase